MSAPRQPGWVRALLRYQGVWRVTVSGLVYWVERKLPDVEWELIAVDVDLHRAVVRAIETAETTRQFEAERARAAEAEAESWRIKRRRAKASGRIVELYDTAHADYPEHLPHQNGRRWLVVCHHGAQHWPEFMPDLTAARRALAHGIEWCQLCQREQP